LNKSINEGQKNKYQILLDKNVAESVILEYMNKQKYETMNTNKIISSKNTSFILDSNPNIHLIDHNQLTNEVQFEKEQLTLLNKFQKKNIDIDIWSPKLHEVIPLNKPDHLQKLYNSF
jgi:hypothetical protein